MKLADIRDIEVKNIFHDNYGTEITADECGRGVVLHKVGPRGAWRSGLYLTTEKARETATALLTMADAVDNAEDKEEE